jgi:N-methylhydantoinase B
MDAIRAEVMRNRFAAIAEEASNVAYRTAYTTFVKQTQDYQVAMASLDGEFFAYPTKSGTTGSCCLNVRACVDAVGIENLKPGDVLISNDPFSTDGLCTHTMDIHLIRPVFRDGRLICFAWSFMHASDIGGSVPGSISTANSEVFQEGIRISKSFLYREGVFNEQLWRIFEDNTRIPYLIRGDIGAMLSALELLDRRANEICDKLGVDVFFESIDEVLQMAEIKSREIIASFKKGVFEFHDYAEIFAGQDQIFITAKMTVDDDGISMDFTGSDPQINLAMNFVTSNGRAHPFLCQPLFNYIQTVATSIPINGGIIRPIKTFAPLGTVMNATFPAAMGNRYASVLRVFDVILGCLNQAVPGGIAAAGSGTSGIISVSSVEPATGRRHVSVVEPLLGGSGGRCKLDAVDGSHGWAGALRSAPVEIVEQETQLLIRAFHFQPDSAGAGEYRGGSALRIELENLGYGALIAVRALDRFRFRPWGVQGGGCGTRGHAVLNAGTPEEKQVPNLNILELELGDVLTIVTPGGGGFGDPKDRAPSSVLTDVRGGHYTEAKAEELYGVVIENDAVDVERTVQVRAAMPASDKSLFFTFDATRRELESKWPPAVHRFLSGLILSAQPGVRQYMMKQIKQDINGDDQIAVVTEDMLKTIALRFDTTLAQPQAAR